MEEEGVGGRGGHFKQRREEKGGRGQEVGVRREEGGGDSRDCEECVFASRTRHPSSQHARQCDGGICQQGLRVRLEVHPCVLAHLLQQQAGCLEVTAQLQQAGDSCLRW
jgi:hypothetical protein